ncbi:Alpha/Beta hydrolase protein [Auriculariales sp. MPI-PUGE-AT-0066]|nr:Alpha/Beta hydrolase protein [Auriculariales sp. MPI-PUGE-AT-0066]
MRFASFAALVFVAATSAAPTRRSATTLQSAQINSFIPYTHIAGAGYCQPANTLSWNCGIHCNATPGFVTTAVGGNGLGTPWWLVGYYPPLHSIFVSFQGTAPQRIIPLFIDIAFTLEPLNSTKFPGLSSAVQIHSGFGDAQTKSSNDVLKAVKTTMARYPSANIVTTGHSLGAAIAQISAVHLKLNLSSRLKIKYIGFSAPRVGNKAWADLVDSLIGDVTHINNKRDFVPTLPPLLTGFAHPSGEIHITENETWQLCRGHDSMEPGCTNEAVPNILSWNITNHDGPFNGINLGSAACLM